MAPINFKIKFSMLASLILEITMFINPSFSYASAIYELDATVGFYFVPTYQFGHLVIGDPNVQKITGGSEGNAIEGHIPQSDMTEVGSHFHFDGNGDFVIDDVYGRTFIWATGEARKPYGYAWTDAKAEVGFTFENTESVTFTLTMTQLVFMSVSTQEDGEVATASFEYLIDFDGNFLKPVKIMQKSQNGVCITVSCNYFINESISLELTAAPGKHYLLLDPSFSNPDYASVPEPTMASLVILGLAGMGFGIRRKSS